MSTAMDDGIITLNFSHPNTPANVFRRFRVTTTLAHKKLTICISVVVGYHKFPGVNNDGNFVAEDS